MTCEKDNLTEEITQDKCHLPEEMTGDKDDDDADEDDGQVQFTRVGIAATRMRKPLKKVSSWRG